MRIKLRYWDEDGPFRWGGVYGEDDDDDGYDDLKDFEESRGSNRKEPDGEAGREAADTRGVDGVHRGHSTAEIAAMIARETAAAAAGGDEALKLPAAFDEDDHDGRSPSAAALDAALGTYYQQLGLAVADDRGRAATGRAGSAGKSVPWPFVVLP